MQVYQKQTMHFPWPYTVHFGDDISYDIPHNGDILKSFMLLVRWPTTDPVVESVGTKMIYMMELKSGNTIIERIYGDNIYINNDINISSSKRAGLSNIVGTYTTTPLTEYYVQCPFSYNLPLSVPLSIHIIFNQPNVFMSVPYINPIDVYAIVEYVYLSDIEKLQYYSPISLLTKSYQRLEYTIQPNTSYVQIITSFVNPVKEFYWYMDTNDIKSIQLSFNGVVHFSNNVGTNNYLHIIQPLQYHKRVPDSNVLTYSFALEPMKDEPTGEFNMLNIPNQTHEIWLTPSSSSRVLLIYALSYNICTIANGQLNMRYVMTESGFKN